jgi:prevent-host-death family protein
MLSGEAGFAKELRSRINGPLRGPFCVIMEAGRWNQQEIVMMVSVTEAKGQLTELVRRAEAGEEIILTRHGHAAVRFVAVKPAQDRQSRRALLEAVQASAAAKASSGPSAARSQDYLYDDDGTPA